MKYLILLLVVLAVLWFWRNARGSGTPGAHKKPGKDALPQDMVRCPVCSVHLPRTDALPGPDGQLYCCAAHREHARGK
jgi:uncharacterized protein